MAITYLREIATCLAMTHVKCLPKEIAVYMLYSDPERSKLYDLLLLIFSLDQSHLKEHLKQ